MRWLAKYLLSLALYYTGLVRLFVYVRERLGHSRIRFFTYHGVNDSPKYLDMFVETGKFDRQLAYFKSHMDVISMAEAVDKIKAGQKPQRDTVVITFDDGYRDNYVNVLPAIKRHGVPVTIYLATAHIDNGTPTFAYLLMIAVDRTHKRRLDMTDYGLGIYELGSFKNNERAVRDIDEFSKNLNQAEREALRVFVLERLGISADNSAFANTMLSWENIREMRDHGVSFGSHTMNHPVLSHLPADEVEREIVSSKVMIEEKAGEKVTFFAYPYGGHSDISEQVVDIVRRNSFSSAVVFYRDLPHPDKLFTLGRVMINNEKARGPFGRFSLSMFACEASGVFEVIFNRH
jgi:peptidoglycan/xylan/chitin deacetylase (PgdA/CDA1 family)